MNRIAFSVILAGLVIAGGLLVSSGLAEPAVVRGPSTENVTALRKERRDVLRESAAMAGLHRNVRMDDASIRRITINLLNAELDLATDRAGRITLREQTVEQFKAIEEMVAAQVKGARAARSELLEAKAARLQAEIDLLLETADEK